MKHTPEPRFICTTEPAEIRTHPYGGVIIGETIPNAYNAERAVACVNACAGMADPATEIQAMRAALEEAYEALKAIDDLHNYDFPHVGDFSDTAIEAFNKGNATLAKLKPLLNP